MNDQTRLKKPEKKELMLNDGKISSQWFGYNRACDDWEKWHDQEIQEKDAEIAALLGIIDFKDKRLAAQTVKEVEYGR